MVEWGVGSSGCSLAARLLGSPDLYVITNEPLGGLVRLWILDLPLGETYGKATLPKLAGPTSPFPYGWAVEPP